MPYQTIWRDRGVEWRYSGVLTGSELLASNEAIYGDPRFDDLRWQLVDLSDVTGFDVSERNMKFLAHFDAAAARTNPKIRVAVIAPHSGACEITDFYQQHSREISWETQQFTTREAAEAWLGI